MNGLISLERVLGKKKLLQCDVKCDTNAIVKDDGTAVVWPFQCKQYPGFEPITFQLPNQIKIVNVTLGFEFAIFLANHGALYSLGKDNSCGQLGLGDLEPRYTPTLIRGLMDSGETVSQVSCGFKHVIVRTANGKIYTWGWGERGQLGHGNDKNLPFPRKVAFPSNNHYTCSVVQAGYRSSYAIMDGRKIWWWGSNGTIHKLLAPQEYLNEIHDEVYCKKMDFKPFKICTTWSRTLSVTYVTVADVRKLPDLKHSNKEILLKKILDLWCKNYFDLRPDIDTKYSANLEGYLIRPLTNYKPKERTLHAEDVKLTEFQEFQLATKVLNFINVLDDLDPLERQKTWGIYFAKTNKNRRHLYHWQNVQHQARHLRNRGRDAAPVQPPEIRLRLPELRPLARPLRPRAILRGNSPSYNSKENYHDWRHQT
jgi:hypothetical protein